MGRGGSVISLPMLVLTLAGLAAYACWMYPKFLELMESLGRVLQ